MICPQYAAFEDAKYVYLVQEYAEKVTSLRRLAFGKKCRSCSGRSLWGDQRKTGEEDARRGCRSAHRLSLSLSLAIPTFQGRRHEKANHGDGLNALGNHTQRHQA